MGTRFRDFKTMDMLVGTRIRGLSISERKFTFLIFCWVPKFVAFPTPEIHENKCPTNRNSLHHMIMVENKAGKQAHYSANLTLVIWNNNLEYL